MIYQLVKYLIIRFQKYVPQRYLGRPKNVLKWICPYRCWMAPSISLFSMNMQLRHGVWGEGGGEGLENFGIRSIQDFKQFAFYNN